MDKPLISICIPTNNRAPFIREALESITCQFTDAAVSARVSVTVLDNRSEDGTEAVVGEFTARYPNIRYIKDDAKRKLVPGIIKVASMADGEYVWVFSDDDLQSPQAIKTIIAFLDRQRPDIISTNLGSFIEKGIVRKPNLLEQSGE